MGHAEKVIREFWRIQDEGDYAALSVLFADDAVLVDPIYGTYEGATAITEFMQLMNVQVKKRGAHFVADEICGDETTAWAQWRMIFPTGERTGVGVYKVADGKLTYYRDYMNPPEHGPGGSQ